MLIYLAMVCVVQLNIFPAKGGVSEYFSPHVILTQLKLDYNKHCKIRFGTYVQANEDNEPANDISPWVIDAIMLRPMNNGQGGYELINLATGLLITRDNWRKYLTFGLVMEPVWVHMDGWIDRVTQSVSQSASRSTGSTVTIIGCRSWNLKAVQKIPCDSALVSSVLEVGRIPKILSEERQSSVASRWASEWTTWLVPSYD